MSSRRAPNLPEVQTLIEYLRGATYQDLGDAQWISGGISLWRKAQEKCAELNPEEIAKQAKIDITIVKATSLGASYKKRMSGVLAAMFSDNHPAAAMSVFLGSSAGFQTVEGKTSDEEVKRAFQTVYQSFLGDKATSKILKSVVVEDLNRYLNFAKTSGADNLHKDYNRHVLVCKRDGVKPLDRLDFLNTRIQEASFVAQKRGESVADLALIIGKGANEMGSLSTVGADSCFVSDGTIYIHHATSDDNTLDQERQALNILFAAMNTTRQHMIGNEKNPFFNHSFEVGYLIAGRFDSNNVVNVRHGDGTGYQARKALAPHIQSKSITQEDVYGLGQLKLVGLVKHCANPTELAMLLSHNIHITGTPTLDLYKVSRDIIKLLRKEDTRAQAQDLAVKTMASIVERSAKCLTVANLEKNSSEILNDSLEEISIMMNQVMRWSMQDPRYGALFSDAMKAVEEMLEDETRYMGGREAHTKVVKMKSDLKIFQLVTSSGGEAKNIPDIAMERIRAYHDDALYVPAEGKDHLAQARQEELLANPEVLKLHRRAKVLHDINFKKLTQLAIDELESGGVPLDNSMGALLNFLGSLNPEEGRDRYVAMDLAKKQPLGIFSVNNPRADGNAKTLRGHATDLGVENSTYHTAKALFNYHNLDNGQRVNSRYPFTNKLIECADRLASPHFLDHGTIFGQEQDEETIKSLLALAKANDCVYSSTKEERAKPRKKTGMKG